VGKKQPSLTPGEKRMPFEIRFDNLPAGYAAQDKKEGDTHASVIATEFTSSEDGDLFVSRLEGIPSEILSKIQTPERIREGTVDHLLAVIRPDKSATVYINELTLRGRFKIKRPFAEGEAVYSNDIADIEMIELLLGDKDVAPPSDAAVLLIFSVGWRKGLFYDFRPLFPPKVGPQSRKYDLAILLGQYYAYLMFQDRFKLTDQDWANLTKQQWFPFIGLEPQTITKMLSKAKKGDPIDDLLPQIQQDLAKRIPFIKAKWIKSPLLKDHFRFLETAIERHVQGDYISAATILFTRIEGILRSYGGCDETGAPAAQQRHLTKAITRKGLTNAHAYSLLMPNKFESYLRNVYFAQFDVRNPETLSVVNRNTVSHGVVPAESFSLKASTIGLLIFDQLSYYSGQKPLSHHSPP
jgi:hypothetical protein